MAFECVLVVEESNYVWGGHILFVAVWLSGLRRKLLTIHFRAIWFTWIPVSLSIYNCVQYNIELCVRIFMSFLRGQLLLALFHTQMDTVWQLIKLIQFIWIASHILLPIEMIKDMLYSTGPAKVGYVCVYVCMLLLVLDDCSRSWSQRHYDDGAIIFHLKVQQLYWSIHLLSTMKSISTILSISGLVGSRTVLRLRTQMEIEWFIVRRYTL